MNCSTSLRKASSFFFFLHQVMKTILNDILFSSRVIIPLNTKGHMSLLQSNIINSWLPSGNYHIFGEQWSKMSYLKCCIRCHNHSATHCSTVTTCQSSYKGNNHIFSFKYSFSYNVDKCCLYPAGIDLCIIGKWLTCVWAGTDPLSLSFVLLSSYMPWPGIVFREMQGCV